VVETDLDRDGSVDQSDKGGGYSDEGGRSPVAGTDVTSDIGDETTSDDKEGLLSDKSRSVKEVDDLLEGLKWGMGAVSDLRSRDHLRTDLSTHVHVLVELSSVDELENGGNLVVSKVLLDGLLVDTSNGCGMMCDQAGLEQRKTRCG
jgi:hypothetical protein